MIGTDLKLFESGSHVRARNISFGHLARQFHIIVFTPKGLNLKPEQISGNTWIYPTNSSSRYSYISDAVKIGLELGKFDLVTTQDPFESGWAGYRLARKLKAKLHVQLHTDFQSPYFAKSSLLNRIRVMIGKFILRRANGIRVVSSRIKKSLSRLNLGASIDVIPVFIDVRGYSNDRDLINPYSVYPDFKKIILTVSRLEKEKNLELGIMAFKDLLKTNKDIGYVIVGHGSLKNDLENLVKREGLEKQVIFVGHKKDTIPYYKNANVYLSTSAYEGYGLSMTEAVLSSLPVISTDVGIAGDVLINNVNSLICPVGDKECIVKALERLLKEENTVELFRKNNREISENLIPQFEYAYFENYRKSWLKALNND
jgi:glycosyltransferase involved in cell wall biosynthesis